MMERRYTKKQIVESIKHWKKMLESADPAESGSPSKVSISELFNKLVMDGYFDAYARWWSSQPAVKMPAEAVAKLKEVFAKSSTHGEKFVGFKAVLSREEHAQRCEDYGDDPTEHLYEDYIDDEKAKLEELFTSEASRQSFQSLLEPKMAVLLDNVQIDGQLHSVLAVPYEVW